MIRLLSIFLFCIPFTNSALFAAVSSDKDKEMQTYQKSMKESFKQFPDKPVQGSSRPGAALSGNRGSSSNFNSAYYDRVSKSPYAKSEVLKTLSTLSDSLAKTAGSALALDSANKARQFSKALSGSSDADFRHIGDLLNQEADAIEKGDRARAEKIAQSIAAIKRPYVTPGYKPNREESQMSQAFKTAIAGIVASLASVLGGTLAMSILSSLGLSSDLAAGILKDFGVGAATSAAKGGSTSKSADKEGADAVRKTGSAANTEIKKIPARTNSSSSQTGSAPSAK